MKQNEKRRREERREGAKTNGTEKETGSRDANVACKDVETRNEKKGRVSLGRKTRRRRRKGTKKDTGSRDTIVERKEVKTQNDEKGNDSPGRTRRRRNRKDI